MLRNVTFDDLLLFALTHVMHDDDDTHDRNTIETCVTFDRTQYAHVIDDACDDDDDRKMIVDAYDAIAFNEHVSYDVARALIASRRARLLFACESLSQTTRDTLRTRYAFVVDNARERVTFDDDRIDDVHLFALSLLTCFDRATQNALHDNDDHVTYAMTHVTRHDASRIIEQHDINDDDTCDYNASHVAIMCNLLRAYVATQHDAHVRTYDDMRRAIVRDTFDRMLRDDDFVSSFVNTTHARFALQRAINDERAYDRNANNDDVHKRVVLTIAHAYDNVL